MQRCFGNNKEEEEEGKGAATVKGHSVLQLDVQALRGYNKKVTTGRPLWKPPHLTQYFVKCTVSCNWTAFFTSFNFSKHAQTYIIAASDM